MSCKPRPLMMSLLVGLPIVLVGFGLATGRDPRSETSGSYLPLGPVHVGPVQTPTPAMAVPAVPANMPVYLPRNEPVATVNRAAPLSLWGIYPFGAASSADVPRSLAAPPLAVTPTTVSSPIKMLPFQEAHWQGLEVVPLTKGLKRVLKIISDNKGVIIDDVTAPADMEGFLAGDLITSVGQIATHTLEGFIEAADRVRDRRRTEVRLLRKGKLHSLVLTGLQGRLGAANGETAPMIKPGSRTPHGYKGACTNCHRIGTTGQLAVDPGDLLTRAAPPIRAGQTPPHRDRGECTACHTIIQ